MKKYLALGGMALGLALALGSSALAQPQHLRPASLLIYPLFDSQPESATIINVTNTNEDRTNCGNGFRAGDVTVHYVYYGQEPDGGVCLEFDRFEDLTPADTLTVLASDHNPEGEVGFLTVAAMDPETGDKIDFDFLIGSAYVANSSLDIMWSYTPYPFRGQADDDANPAICPAESVEDPGEPGQGLSFDAEDDGYDFFPECLYVDSFIEESPGLFDNQLTLMSTSGQDYINEIDISIWNNQEDRFSRTFKFVCHTTVALSEISAVASNLGGDPDELVVGQQSVQTGWVKLQGRAILDLAGNPVPSEQELPAILGVFMQIIRSDFTAGHALHYTGQLETEIPFEAGDDD